MSDLIYLFSKKDNALFQNLIEYNIGWLSVQTQLSSTDRDTIYFLFNTSREFMVTVTLSIRDDYWETFQLQLEDMQRECQPTTVLY